MPTTDTDARDRAVAEAFCGEWVDPPHDIPIADLLAALATARAEEREAVMGLLNGAHDGHLTMDDIAAALRARGEG